MLHINLISFSGNDFSLNNNQVSLIAIRFHYDRIMHISGDFHHGGMLFNS